MEYLKKADELLVQWRDRDYIYDLAEKYPETRIILETPNELEDNAWQSIHQYEVICKAGFMLCVVNELQMHIAKDFGYKFFLKTPIKDPYILNALIDFGVSAARISGILCHSLDYVNTLPIEIRVIANYSDSAFGYQKMRGAWFRPEDLYKIEAIDVCEFFHKDNRDEQALYRIYAENHEWPGELNLIIKDIEDKDILNRMLPPEFQEKRSNCHQRCQYGGHCHLCDRMTSLANPIHLEYITKFPKKPVEYYDPEEEINE